MKCKITLILGLLPEHVHIEYILVRGIIGLMIQRGFKACPFYCLLILGIIDMPDDQKILK